MALKGPYIINLYQDNAYSICLHLEAILKGDIFVAEILMLATCPFSLKWKRNLRRCQFLIRFLHI